MSLLGFVWAFSSWGELGLLFVAVCGNLTGVASLTAEHRLQANGLQRLHHVGSIVVLRGLSCSAACGIFPDQGLNPCPLGGQVASYLLSHQGNPLVPLDLVLERFGEATWDKRRSIMNVPEPVMMLHWCEVTPGPDLGLVSDGLIGVSY